MAKDLSAVRYQLLDEDSTVEDTKHFETLRRLEFFTEFENIEIWEVLRVAVWREVSPNVALIREGDRSKFFGVIVSGSVEVSIEGKALCRLGPSEPVGECVPPSVQRHALLDRRHAGADPVSRNQRGSPRVVVGRTARAGAQRPAQPDDQAHARGRIAAAQGMPAVQSLSASQVGGSNKPGGGLDLELAPM
jgi:hypothetical protein